MILTRRSLTICGFISHGCASLYVCYLLFEFWLWRCSHLFSNKMKLETCWNLFIGDRHLILFHHLWPIYANNCRCADGENATLAEFEQVLKAMKIEALIPLAPRVFDLFDNNRDGTVDMREILCGLSSLRNSRGDDALQLCFQVNNSKRTLY